MKSITLQLSNTQLRDIARKIFDAEILHQMEEQVQDEELRAYIHSRRVTEYHRDEYRSGMI